MKAYCYRSGQIKFGKLVPDGAIEIPGNIKQIKVRARLAYDNKTLLVPGVPEAENDTEAFSALKKFLNFVKQ